MKMKTNSEFFIHRIRKQLAAGAWCPFQQIRDGAYEFLQVR